MIKVKTAKFSDKKAKTSYARWLSKSVLYLQRNANMFSVWKQRNLATKMLISIRQSSKQLHYVSFSFFSAKTFFLACCCSFNALKKGFFGCLQLITMMLVYCHYLYLNHTVFLLLYRKLVSRGFHWLNNQTREHIKTTENTQST